MTHCNFKAKCSLLSSVHEIPSLQFLYFILSLCFHLYIIREEMMSQSINYPISQQKFLNNANLLTPVSVCGPGSSFLLWRTHGRAGFLRSIFVRVRFLWVAKLRFPVLLFCACLSFKILNYTI